MFSISCRRLEWTGDDLCRRNTSRGTSAMLIEPARVSATHICHRLPVSQAFRYSVFAHAIAAPA
jgi:hypothetical protein